MSRLQSLKVFINRRLTAAVEEICGHVERTITEYEEEMDRRHRKLLDVVLKPGVKLRRESDVQQLLVVKEEDPPEQQEQSSDLDQEDPELSHIKEEQEELWTSQKGEQLQGLEETDIKFPFTPVPVKSEDDEEKAHSSQLHQRKTEHMETEADGEDCGGPEPARNSGPNRHSRQDTDDKNGDSSEPETDDSDDWKETRESQSGLNSLKNDEVPVSGESCNTDKNLCICSECGKRFGNKTNLKVHMLIHTGEKVSCTVCRKRFPGKRNLIRHMKRHTTLKPFSCSVCKKCFRYRGDVRRHMSLHTGQSY